MRYGVHSFRQFFEQVVDCCQHAGCVWGKELYADGTLVDADADRDKISSRFAVEQHLRGLFGAAYKPRIVWYSMVAQRLFQLARRP
jgi:hypothetical protein